MKKMIFSLTMLAMVMIATMPAATAFTGNTAFTANIATGKNYFSSPTHSVSSNHFSEALLKVSNDGFFATASAVNDLSKGGGLHNIETIYAVGGSFDLLKNTGLTASLALHDPGSAGDAIGGNILAPSLMAYYSLIPGMNATVGIEYMSFINGDNNNNGFNTHVGVEGLQSFGNFQISGFVKIGNDTTYDENGPYFSGAIDTSYDCNDSWSFTGPGVTLTRADGITYDSYRVAGIIYSF